MQRETSNELTFRVEVKDIAEVGRQREEQQEVSPLVIGDDTILVLFFSFDVQAQEMSSANNRVCAEGAWDRRFALDNNVYENDSCPSFRR